MQHRIGIDLGGTKTEILVLDPAGREVLRRRTTSARDYAASIATMAGLVAAAETALGVRASVGVGIPGAISPATGRVKNANSTWLNDRPLDRDLAEALGREVRVENDANCLALSEATDGAGAGARVVFAAILGTGCGGGVVVDGRVLGGRHRVAGEWGHLPLPWAREDEFPLPRCWCGRVGCLETLISGPALAADADGPGARDASALPSRAAAGDARAAAALARHADRLARGLAMVCDLLDPDAIVLGGGLSNMAHLYERVPGLLAPHVFSDAVSTPIPPARHGDSSGVRGAAWLWPG